MEDHKTVVKFYDGAGKPEYRDLFKRGDGQFFCHRGAEYQSTILYPWYYQQVVAKDEVPLIIEIKAIYTMTEDYHLVGDKYHE